MIEFFSTWAEQIVLAVIIATIIEMLLPNNKNKKYVQMIIGIYILFNIISPIIKNKEVFSFDEYNIEDNTIDSGYVVDQSSMDKRLEKIYLDELEKKVITIFEINGYTVNECDIDAELDTTKKNAGVHMIVVKVKGPADDKEIYDIQKEIIKEFEIDEDKIGIQIQ